MYILFFYFQRKKHSYVAPKNLPLFLPIKMRSYGGKTPPVFWGIDTYDEVGYNIFILL